MKPSVALLVALPASLLAQQPAAGCNQPAAQPSIQVATPSSPFEPIATADGCWIFVTLTAPDPGVAVYRRSGGQVTLARTIPLRSGGTGAVLTHDGKLLVVAAGPNIAFLDVGRMTAGTSDPVLGYLDAGQPVGAIYANVTRDDRFLFVALERAASMLVYDLAKARRSGFDTTAVIGGIPLGNAPIAVTFSPDERYLYSTSQSAPPAWKWPVACKPEAAQNPATESFNHSKSAVHVIDVKKATTDPEHAEVARVAIGCNVVRLVLSPDGQVAYASARGEHALYALDTKKLLGDSAHAVIARVPAGTAPVGIAVFDGGRRLAVTSSNRFAGAADDVQPLTILDASKLSQPTGAILGEIPAGAFPRELRVTADGKTLLITNFASKTLQLVDLQRLPLKLRS